MVTSVDFNKRLSEIESIYGRRPSKIRVKSLMYFKNKTNSTGFTKRSYDSKTMKIKVLAAEGVEVEEDSSLEYHHIGKCVDRFGDVFAGLIIWTIN